MDDGQSIWKICLSLREVGEDAREDTGMKDTGVKKLLLISAFPDTPESYGNLRLMMEDLGIESLDFTTTVDLKLALLLVGKPLGKPKYNCPFCDSCPPFSGTYNLYTMARLFSEHKVISSRLIFLVMNFCINLGIQ